MKIQTKFDIGQNVLITPIKSVGRVQNIFISRNSLEYNVRYFEGSKPETCYFLEDELALDKKPEIGFKHE